MKTLLFTRTLQLIQSSLSWSLASGENTIITITTITWLAASRAAAASRIFIRGIIALRGAIPRRKRAANSVTIVINIVIIFHLTSGRQSDPNSLSPLLFFFLLVVAQLQLRIIPTPSIFCAFVTRDRMRRSALLFDSTVLFNSILG